MSEFEEPNDDQLAAFLEASSKEHDEAATAEIDVAFIMSKLLWALKERGWAPLNEDNERTRQLYETLVDTQYETAVQQVQLIEDIEPYEVEEVVASVQQLLTETRVKIHALEEEAIIGRLAMLLSVTPSERDDELTDEQRISISDYVTKMKRTLYADMVVQRGYDGTHPLVRYLKDTTPNDELAEGNPDMMPFMLEALERLAGQSQRDKEGHAALMELYEAAGIFELDTSEQAAHHRQGVALMKLVAVRITDTTRAAEREEEIRRIGREYSMEDAMVNAVLQFLNTTE